MYELPPVYIIPYIYNYLWEQNQIRNEIPKNEVQRK